VKIAVLMGGLSSEREISLRTGRGVAQALRNLGHEVVAVDAANGRMLPAGEEERAALPAEALEPSGTTVLARPETLAGADVVFIALHGAAGENGTLQALLDLAGKTYTGSGMLASALAMNKAISKRIFAQAGIPSPVPAGSFLDLFPVSVLTTSTLAQLHALRPESRFDDRRFRMNVVVNTSAEGFVENAWPGRSLQIGDRVRLTVFLPDPRCVMTTLAQDDLPKDNDILRTLARHNRIEVAGGLYPCAGVYAVVEAAGNIRAGDQVSLV